MAVLICYDGSPNAEDAIRAAARLMPGAHAHVLHVWEPLSQVASVPPVPGLHGLLAAGLEELDREGERVSAETAAKGAEIANQAGLHAEPISQRAKRRAWGAILSAADEHDADLIVMGRRGLSGPERWMLGSVSSAVLQHSDRPVLLVPSETG